MPNGPLRSASLDVVTACRSKDLPVLRLAWEGLQRCISFKGLQVYAARRNFRRIRNALGSDVILHDEDDAIPDMRIKELRTLSLANFPRAAGWYFQQLLKLSHGWQSNAPSHYLIWDADTVPLKPLEFFDHEGRMLFTMAAEEHAPYFASYRALLGEEPYREFSFISQHMIVDSAILREMLSIIDQRFPGGESWAWKIMRHLPSGGDNLFSEYETLGHYVKNHYPEKARYRKLRWLRDGSRFVKGIPDRRDLDRLTREYDFVAFESTQRPLRKAFRTLRGWFPI